MKIFAHRNSAAGQETDQTTAITNACIVCLVTLFPLVSCCSSRGKHMRRRHGKPAAVFEMAQGNSHKRLPGSDTQNPNLWPCVPTSHTTCVNANRSGQKTNSSSHGNATSCRVLEAVVFSSRADWIRTSDLNTPSVARYQTTLQPV